MILDRSLCHCEYIVYSRYVRVNLFHNLNRGESIMLNQARWSTRKVFCNSIKLNARCKTHTSSTLKNSVTGRWNGSLVAGNVVSCSWIKLERNLLRCLYKTRSHYINAVVLFEENTGNV